MISLFGDVEAERSLLGAVLQDPSAAAWALAELAPEAFTRPEYKAAWDACGRLYSQGSAVDLTTVNAALRDKQFGDVAGMLVDAVRMTPSPSAAKAYAKLVQEYARRRALRDACAAAVESLGEVDADTACDALMTTLRSGAKSAEWTSYGAVGAAAFDMLDAISRGELRSIPTGLPDVDAALAGGLRRGEVTVLAAGTGQGKSALAMHIAQSAARKGFRVGFISREMSAEQYGIRAIAGLAGVDSGTQLQAKRMSAEQWSAVSEAVAEMARMPISFAFAARTVEDVRRAALQKELDMLVVDYLQILGTQERAASEHLRISVISRTLKEIALDMGIPVLVLSQLKRLPGGVVRRPVLADLKESGSIENDADSVLFLYRPKGPDDEDIPPAYAGWVEAAEDMGDRFLLLEVAKQRMYGTAMLGVCFDMRRMTFYTPERAAAARTERSGERCEQTTFRSARSTAGAE